ncbi:MAG: SDR family oxidoreductase [Bacteroidales bacterium]|nr:SDR family oxidoreductase [Bacteroidales bacterium]
MNRKLALITGAASGLGYEFCRLLAADGYDLVMVDRDREGLEQSASKLQQKSGVTIQSYVKDLGRNHAAGELYKEVEDREFDILINNAGFGLYGHFANTDWEIEETMLHLHVLTLTHLTKLFLQKMIRRGSGRIMNVSSMAAFQPCPTMSLYYASKGYMLYFSEAVANEVKGTGVTVTVLLPGLFNTNFARTAAMNSGSAERQEKAANSTVEQVAKKALKGMMKGKIRVIPGFSNKLMVLLPRFLPRNFVLSALRRIQERLRQ